MKISIVSLALAASAAIGFGGVARGQNVPQQLVVTGKGAETIHDFTTINLATAENIAEACEAAVTAQGGGVHTITILDKSGTHVYMDRMDGQGYINIITSEMKARTTLISLQPSKSYANAVAHDPTQEGQLVQLGFYPVSGGLPIIVNEQLIGVIGVGGYPPHPPVWSDEICAHTALQKVIGPAVPPLLEDVQQTRTPNPNAVPVPRFTATATPKSSLPADEVVGGMGAARVFDGNQISLAAAKKIARGCRDWEASQGGRMGLYILDDAGEYVHIERMDGVLAEDMNTALLKAQTALRERAPTSIDEAQIKNNPAGFTRIANSFKSFAKSGGVPVVVDGQMIGAIGVTVGGGAGGDENCAVQGLRAAFGDHAAVPVYPAAGAGR